MKLLSLSFGGAEEPVCSFSSHCVVSKVYIYDANDGGQPATEIKKIWLSIHGADAIYTIFFVMMFNSTMEHNDCSDMNDTFDFN